MQATRKKKKRIFAMSTAPAAMPPKPKMAAMIAMMKNASDQRNIQVSFRFQVTGRARAALPSPTGPVSPVRTR